MPLSLCAPLRIVIGAFRALRGAPRDLPRPTDGCLTGNRCGQPRSGTDARSPAAGAARAARARMKRRRRTG